MNRSSPSCRLSDKAKKPLKGLRAGRKKDDSGKKKIHFGSCTIAFRTNVSKPANKKAASKVYLHCEASISMFRQKKDAIKSSYSAGSEDTARLAAGDATAKCLGTGTLSYVNLNAGNAFHVQGLHDTPVSVDEIYDDGNLVVFMAKEAVVQDMAKFSVDPSNVIAILSREPGTKL